MKKIFLITLLLLLTTTQSLFLMDAAARQKIERCLQFATLDLQKLEEQIISFDELSIEIINKQNQLNELYSELSKLTLRSPILPQKIQEIKTKATDIEKDITLSLEIQQGITNSYAQEITSPINPIILDEKECNEEVKKLTNKIIFFEDITISYIKTHEEIKNIIKNTETAESFLKNQLKKEKIETTISTRKTIIITISFYALLFILFISRYIYKNYHGNISLLFKSA